DDETLRVNARRIQSDIERIAGVDTVMAVGLRDPEILVSPNPQALAARGLLSTDVADTLSRWWRDTTGGTLKTQSGAWSVGVKGVVTDPQALANLPVMSSSRPGVSARLGEVARIERARAPASQLAATEGRDAISMAITKKTRTNTLELVDELKAFIEREDQVLTELVLGLGLTDDQTEPTPEAIRV